jgi:lipoyl-dependent peroxiredoxin
MPQFSYSAIGTGGRDGAVSSESGSFNHATVPPGSRRPGVTPEELVAAAWAACFGTTLLHTARDHGIDTSDAVCRARVTFHADHRRGEYSISEADLSVYVAGVEPSALEPALAEAHEKCPVSKLLTSGVPDLAVRPARTPLQHPPSAVSQPPD